VKVGVKRPYLVPTMEEVRALPWNGFTVASTFSGAGGSCLGYRMAGFRVLWANEFTEQSARVYRLNHGSTHLDVRDVRDVKPEDVLEATGLGRGDLDVLDGSPPCDSFSLAGKRAAGWGKKKGYAKGIEQRTDDLGLEFVRLLAGLQPKTFVAENVQGLAAGKARGYFLELLGAMKTAGYRVKARVLDAQWLGVPQRRRRLIFVGVREDLGVEPTHPTPLTYGRAVGDACPWIKRGIVEARKFAAASFSGSDPMPTILASGRHDYLVTSEGPPPEGPPDLVAAIARRREEAGTGHRLLTVPECRRLCSFPDDFAMAGPDGDQWRALGMSVPPLMMRAVAREIASLLEEATW